MLSVLLMIRRYKETFTLPFKEKIPCHLEAYESQIKKPLRIIKYIKRYLYMFLKKELINERDEILDSHRKILWINKSAPSLGDSLMDLSSRTLLESRDIDLLTDKKNLPIYDNDLNFKNTFSEMVSLKGKVYDLIIIDSYSTRTIGLKNKLFSDTEFVSIFGFFNGPEVNRVLFSFHRMNNLLGRKMSPSSIEKIARPSMSLINVKSIELPNKYIVISVGGEWEYRTYQFWPEVVKLILNKFKNINIVLVGSENGKDYVNSIISKCSKDRVLDCVGKYSFKETAKIISKCDVFIGCDGGLMHVANCFQRILVPLFARLEPSMQLTESILAFPVFDYDNVNNIPISAIIRNFDSAFKISYKYHQTL